jgi:glutathione S-transferase
MIDLVGFSGQGRVPILLAGGQCISDSWAIAVYLEGTYPDRPSLFGGPSAMAAASPTPGATASRPWFAHLIANVSCHFSMAWHARFELVGLAQAYQSRIQ